MSYRTSNQAFGLTNGSLDSEYMDINFMVLPLEVCTYSDDDIMTLLEVRFACTMEIPHARQRLQNATGDARGIAGGDLHCSAVMLLFQCDLSTRNLQGNFHHNVI